MNYRQAIKFSSNRVLTYLQPVIESVCRSGKDFATFFVLFPSYISRLLEYYYCNEQRTINGS